jgi:hypothetical protein
MLAKLTIGKVILGLIGVNLATVIASLGAHLDAWAPFANTLLLIVLAELARRNGHKIDDTHQSVHATARTALSAAEASAEAERVVKAIGGSLRPNDTTQPPHRDIPEPPAGGPP